MIHGTNPYSKNQHKGNVTSDKANRKDELTISKEAMAMLDQVGGAHELSRQEKVAELKQQVQAGQYEVDAEQVAAKLLDWWK